jgi:hypothetical protein
MKTSKKKTVTYKKRCEFCDKEFTTHRTHARTCSSGCRLKLYKKGYSNPKYMEMVAWFKNPAEAETFFKTLKAGCYNKTKELSGYCYIYKYTQYAIDNGYFKGEGHVCKHKSAVCKKCGSCDKNIKKKP